MKKTVLLFIIFFFISCSMAFGWVKDRIPVKDRSDDPSFATGRGYYYSKDKKPYYIDPDGTSYDLSTGTGGGGSGVSVAADAENIAKTGVSTFWIIGGANITSTVAADASGATFTLVGVPGTGGGVGGVSFYGTDDGSFVDFGTATGVTLFLKGQSGISTTATGDWTTSGGTVYIGLNGSVTSWMQSQVSGYPYNSSVSNWITNITDLAAFSGTTNFPAWFSAVSNEFDNRGAIGATTGVSFDPTSGLTVTGITSYGLTNLESGVSAGGTLAHYDTAGNTTFSIGPGTSSGNSPYMRGALNLESGFQNVHIGSGAGGTGGYRNVTLGHSAGASLASGIDNCFIGHDSGAATTEAAGNAAIGRSSLFNGISAYYNMAIGVNSLYKMTTGDFNIGIGCNAGYSANGDRNIFIGYEAGKYITGANQLFIEPSSTDAPLIYGDFATDSLRFGSGTTETSGASIMVIGQGATSGQTIFGAGNGTGKVPFYVLGDGTMSEVTPNAISAASAYAGTLNLAPAQIDSTELDFTSTGGTTLSGVSAVVITANIFNPDDVVSSVSDNIAIWHVDADKYPNGIILDSVWTQQFGASGYAVNVEEWNTDDNPSVASTIELMTIAAGTFVEEIRGTNIDDRNIAAGGWIFLDLPTTETDQLFIKIKGRIK